jgi:flagellar basal-body rod protein FlgB
VSINFEKALGSAERALIYRSQRAEVLSNNIANADTPNFKARDLEFSAVLASQTKRGLDSPFSLKTTNLKHIAANELASDGQGDGLLYSTPYQPSLIKILWMHSLKWQSLLKTKFILKALLID